MTALTLYRIPRRFVRKLAKPMLLALNAWRLRCSEHEAHRLLVTREALARAELRERMRQVELAAQRRTIGGWQ